MQNENKTLFDLLKNNSIKEMETIFAADTSAAEAVNEQGVSLLLMAVYYRNKDAIALIQKKKKKLSPWEAACTGDLDQLTKLIQQNPLLINSPSPDGFSLLGYACFFSQDAIANWLIENEADVNIVSQNSMKVAPLHSAAAVSNYTLCRLLLENGADVNAIQQGGHTPLHAAAQNGNTELAKLLLDYGADKNLLTEKGESAGMVAKQKLQTVTAEFIENYKTD